LLNSCGTAKTGETNTEQTPVKPAKDVDYGINLSYMDNNIRPQDDFFSYVNGNWMKTTEIPSDKTRWGSFDKLREETDVASLEILHKILNDKFSANSEGEKIQKSLRNFHGLG
jgi:Predicted metalloendopeptidase